MPKYDTAGFTDSSGQYYRHTADCLIRISTKRWHTYNVRVSWMSDKRMMQVVCDALKISPEEVIGTRQERCKCGCHKNGSQQGR